MKRPSPAAVALSLTRLPRVFRVRDRDRSRNEGTGVRQITETSLNPIARDAQLLQENPFAQRSDSGTAGNLDEIVVNRRAGDILSEEDAVSGGVHQLVA